jgi:hypothetical protein
MQKVDEERVAIFDLILKRLFDMIVLKAQKMGGRES